jgi:hypothetical protein
VIFLLLSSFLSAQEGPPAPLGPLLGEAVYGDGRWRPDWPLEIAPDAFTVNGEASAVTVEIVLETGAGDFLRASAYGGIPYRLARDSLGRLSAFPMVLGPAVYPVFAQVEVLYGEEGGIGELHIQAPPAGEAAGEKLAGEEPAEEAETGEPPALLAWSVFFPAPLLPGEIPAGPVKVQRGEEVYFVLFSGGLDRIAETWYGAAGNFTAYFETRLGVEPDYPVRVLGVEGSGFREDYGYESGGNLSSRSGDWGSFSAVYGLGRPLYRKAGRDYALQWDEGGLLTGMRGLSPPGEGPAAFRYEYECDSRGNWIRRREILLFPQEDLLLPGSMRETVRRIDYTEGD